MLFRTEHTEFEGTITLFPLVPQVRLGTRELELHASFLFAMRRWQRFELPYFWSLLGKENSQIKAVGFRDLFDGTDTYSQHLTGFKSLIILERYADQISRLFLA